MKHVQQHVPQAENVVMQKMHLVSLDEILTSLNFKIMDCQVNILIKRIFSATKILVTNTLSAQILVPSAPIEKPSTPVTDVKKLKKITGTLQKNIGSIQSALKKSKNQIRSLKNIFEK